MDGQESCSKMALKRRTRTEMRSYYYFGVAGVYRLSLCCCCRFSVSIQASQEQLDRSVLLAFPDLTDSLDTRDCLVVAEILDSRVRLDRLEPPASLAVPVRREDLVHLVMNFLIYAYSFISPFYTVAQNK